MSPLSPAVAAHPGARPLPRRTSGLSPLPATPTTTTEAAGRGGNRFPCASLVAGIEPHKGVSLLQEVEGDSSGFTTPLYIARTPFRDVILDVSRFDFEPTQARFNWLVDNGFPSGTHGPLRNREIDAGDVA